VKTIFSANRKQLRRPHFVSVLDQSGYGVSYRTHSTREYREEYQNSYDPQWDDPTLYRINVYPKRQNAQPT
jgi:hypothetical protein